MIWGDSQRSAAGRVPPGRRGQLLRGGAAVAAAAAVIAGGAPAAMAAPAVVTAAVACGQTALAHAISNAPADAILSLKSGCVYRLTTALPTVTSNLTIQGNGDTIRRSNSADFTALEDAGAQLSINQLTMSGFSSPTNVTAGALENDGGTLTVTKCQFTGNDGGYGGAILNVSGGLMSVTDTSFAYNSADYGGAILNEDTSTATLAADTFYHNSAIDGGALYIYGGTVTVRGSGGSASARTFFTDNTATGSEGGAIDDYSGVLIASAAAFTGNRSGEYAGAIEADSGVSTVSDSSFTRNYAEYGGAVEMDSTALNLTGDTFTGNSGYDGGAIVVYDGTTTLDKTVIFGNKAQDAGGGIYRSSGSVILTHGSLVRGNRPDNCYGFSC
jgi:predicted outer membrane repeat protein